MNKENTRDTQESFFKNSPSQESEKINRDAIQAPKCCSHYWIKFADGAQKCEQCGAFFPPALTSGTISS